MRREEEKENEKAEGKEEAKENEEEEEERIKIAFQKPVESSQVWHVKLTDDEKSFELPLFRDNGARNEVAIVKIQDVIDTDEFALLEEYSNFVTTRS